MVFSSFDFIIFFLPFAVVGYFLVGRLGHTLALNWLIFCSLLYYSWWNFHYTPLIVGLTVFNYLAGAAVRKTIPRNHFAARLITGLAVAADLSVLGYCKYTGFIFQNLDNLFSTNLPITTMILPLGISFFTFQKIGYLIDCYRDKITDGRFLRFGLFVTFFPQLIAGPIVHHADVMPQFDNKSLARCNWDNIARGLFIFSIGLFKKVCIADSLARFATYGFDQSSALSFFESCITILSYTFQIYFDFSGYSDMAIGAALLFNVNLPQNFNSPYKAENIRDFWRRWHMTLSRFLRDYLYIPLGGNRHGNSRQFFALLATFLLGGLWHGAAWTFVAWGLLHGIGIIVNLLWNKTKFAFSTPLARVITFIFSALAWVLFRAKNWHDALKIYDGLTNFPKHISHLGVTPHTPLSPPYILSLSLIALWVFCNRMPNSNELAARFTPMTGWLLFTFALTLCSFWSIGNYSEFLYFQF